MTDREAEQRLAGALERTAPNDLDVILSRCGGQNGRVTDMEPIKKKNIGRWLIAACAALVLVGGGGGVYYHQSLAVASVVSLDVNPSIELKVNRNEKVLSCTALNEEAAAVLFSMDGGRDLEGTKLDVAVNAIVGALVREGYLDSVSSAILISVEDSDQARAARIQQELVASVDGVLRTQAPGTDVLSQVVDQGTLRVEYANFDSISSGKAALVQKVIDNNGFGADAFDQLAALSVEELSDLLKTGEARIPIGKSAALLAAEGYAGTLALDSVVADVDPELDERPPHYDVELKTAWGEFDYTVDAFTGQVLSGPRDILDAASSGGGQTGQDQPPAGSADPGPADPGPADPGPADPGSSVTGPADPGSSVTGPAALSGQDVGQDAAKRAALDNAGLTEDQVTNWKVEREWDDGRLEYEIEFWCGTTEYDCTVDGHTGSILSCGIDHHGNSSDRHHGGSWTGGGTASSTSDIGAAAAKAAALTHAGVTESQTTGMKVEQDWDDGRLEYEVEFNVGWIEYEYTIDGATGNILEYQREQDD